MYYTRYEYQFRASILSPFLFPPTRSIFIEMLFLFLPEKQTLCNILWIFNWKLLLYVLNLLHRLQNIFIPSLPYLLSPWIPKPFARSLVLKEIPPFASPECQQKSTLWRVGEMPWIPPWCSCCPALASSNRYILWLCRYPHVYVLIPNIASFDIEQRRGQDEMSISSSSSSDSKWDIRMWCKQHMHLDMEEHCARPSVIKCKFFSFNIPCKYLQHKKNYYDILVARTYFWRHSVTLIVVYCIVRCCCWKQGRGERKQSLYTRVDDMTGEAGKIIITWITFPLV